MMPDRSKLKLWPLFVLLLAVPASAGFGAYISPETIKATYIIQMQKFVTSGNPPHGLNRICYYERPGVPLSESVGQQIEKYVKAHPDDHLPIVKKFEAVRDLSGCDIFYIPLEEDAEIDNILTALRSAETLTVSGAQRFILRGGMVGFVIDENDRVKMEANLKNMKGKNIHIDAQLLEIMLRVIDQ